MAKNDAIIIDGILDDRVAENIPTSKRDEVFEFFALEQILKDHSLSQEELLSGNIDGRDDGGIDGFFILINGHLLIDQENFFWPKTSAELEVHLVNCKHHEAFKQAPWDNIAATVSEIFDFGIEKRDLKGSYNNALLAKRDLLKSAYRKIASRLASFKVIVTYASRGDANDIGDSIISRGKQIKNIIEQSFTDCVTDIQYLGSSELIDLSRKLPNFSLELPFIEVLGKGERYVLLAKIADYKKFVSDDDNKLRRYLFDSNVRDFMGMNRVNEDIRNTLENDVSTDFWWLNNGVTILATSAKVIGKTIHMEDIQIVNGLQTTESIYKYFQAGGEDSNERSVMVKVIVSKEEDIRDSIIRATNNQTIVELTALHATDKIQRDIEDVLLHEGLYYERRTRYYQNQGIPQFQIITPLYIAAGYLNLILKEPHNASMLKSRFMRSENSYNRIFSEKTSMYIWPQIAKVHKCIDVFLEDVRPVGHLSNDRFLKRYRYLIALIATSKVLGKFNFSPNDLIGINMEAYSPQLLQQIWDIILDRGELIQKKSLPLDAIMDFMKKSAEKFQIMGLVEFESRIKRRGVLPGKPERAWIEKVFEKLPKEPYSVAIYRTLATELGISKGKIYLAVELLKASDRIRIVDKGIHQTVQLFGN